LLLLLLSSSTSMLPLHKILPVLHILYRRQNFLICRICILMEYLR
jgi:hypothetical protein